MNINAARNAGMLISHLGVVMTVFVFLAGCGASLARQATGTLAEDLATAIQRQGDVDTAAAGLPAYLLMVDGFISGDPDNTDLLRGGSRLYALYSAEFVVEAARAKRLSAQALDYARRALCLEDPTLCAASVETLDVFSNALQESSPDRIGIIYDFAVAWGNWVRAHSDDWKAIAELPKIEAMFQHVLDVDESWDRAGAHLYLGILATRLPPAMGGRPDDARAHFERAIELTSGEALLAKVLFARHYARPLFDRALHDRLLTEVLSAETDAEDLILANALARREATRLLESANEYF